MSEAELKNLWSFTNDLWGMIKKYCGQPHDLDSEEFWHDIVEDGRIIVESHGNHRLCIHIVNGVLDYFEEERKKQGRGIHDGKGTDN